MPIAQDGVIKAFVDRRNELTRTRYEVYDCPDEKNRSDKEVDALCKDNGSQRLALEHTRLQTFRSQIRDEKAFTRLVAPVEEAFAGQYPDWHIGITFHYLREGNWNRDIATPLLAWFRAEFEKIPAKDHGYGRPPEFDVPGVGLIWVAKRKGRPGVFVSRTVPSNVVIEDELPELMHRALDHKYERLGQYKADGFRSIMLLDARDPALTNQIDQYVAYLRAKKVHPRDSLDEIWLADVFEGAKEEYVTFYCFKFSGDSAIVKAANYEGAMFGPQYEEYWQKVIAKQDEEQKRT